MATTYELGYSVETRSLKDAASLLDTLSESNARFKQSLSDIQDSTVRYGESLLRTARDSETLSQALTVVSDRTRALGSSFETLTQQINPAIAAAQTFVQTNMPQTMESLEVATKKASEGFKSLQESLPQLSQTFTDKIQNVLPNGLKDIEESVGKIGKSFEGLTASVPQLSQTFTDKVFPVLKSGFQEATALATEFGKSFSGLGDAVLDVGEKFQTSIVDTLGAGLSEISRLLEDPTKSLAELTTWMSKSTASASEYAVALGAVATSIGGVVLAKKGLDAAGVLLTLDVSTIGKSALKRFKEFQEWGEKIKGIKGDFQELLEKTNQAEDSAAERAAERLLSITNTVKNQLEISKGDAAELVSDQLEKTLTPMSQIGPNLLLAKEIAETMGDPIEEWASAISKLTTNPQAVVEYFNANRPGTFDADTLEKYYELLTNGKIVEASNTIRKSLTETFVDFDDVVKRQGSALSQFDDSLEKLGVTIHERLFPKADDNKDSLFDRMVRSGAALLDIMDSLLNSTKGWSSAAEDAKDSVLELFGISKPPKPISHDYLLNAGSDAVYGGSGVGAPENPGGLLGIGSSVVEQVSTIARVIGDSFRGALASAMDTGGFISGIREFFSAFYDKLLANMNEAGFGKLAYNISEWENSVRDGFTSFKESLGALRGDFVAVSEAVREISTLLKDPETKKAVSNLRDLIADPVGYLGRSARNTLINGATSMGEAIVGGAGRALNWVGSQFVSPARAEETEDDSEEGAAQKGPGGRSITREDIRKLIIEEAKRQGASPSAMLAMASVENDFKHYDKDGNVSVTLNPDPLTEEARSHATGVMQLQPGTFRETAEFLAGAGGLYPGRKFNINDLKDNIAVGIAYAQRMAPYADLQSRVDPSTDYYGALRNFYHFGPSGGAKYRDNADVAKFMKAMSDNRMAGDGEDSKLLESRVSATAVDELYKAKEKTFSIFNDRVTTEAKRHEAALGQIEAKYGKAGDAEGAQLKEKIEALVAEEDKLHAHNLKVLQTEKKSYEDANRLFAAREDAYNSNRDPSERRAAVLLTDVTERVNLFNRSGDKVGADAKDVGQELAIEVKKEEEALRRLNVAKEEQLAFTVEVTKAYKQSAEEGAKAESRLQAEIDLRGVSTAKIAEVMNAHKAELDTVKTGNLGQEEANALLKQYSEDLVKTKLEIEGLVHEQEKKNQAQRDEAIINGEIKRVQTETAGRIRYLETELSLIGKTNVERRVALALVAEELRLKSEHASPQAIRSALDAVRPSIVREAQLEGEKIDTQKAEKQKEAYAKHTVDSITNYTTNAFEKMLDGSKMSWQSFWDDARKTAIRAFASLASDLVVRIPVQYAVSGLMGVPMSSMGGGGMASTMLGGIFGGGARPGGTGALGDMLGGDSWIGRQVSGVRDWLGSPMWGQSQADILSEFPEISPAGLDAAASSAPTWGGALSGIGSMGMGAFQMAQGNYVGGAAGLIGGGVSMLGPMLGLGSMAGPIGMGIGLVGSLLGGMFGGSKSVGPNANANITTQGGRFAFNGAGADNGGDSSQLEQQVRQFATLMNSMTDSYGLKVGDYWGGLDTGLGGGASSTTELLRRILTAGTITGTGLTGKVIDHAAFNAGNGVGTDPSQLGTDLAFAQKLEDAGAALTKFATGLTAVRNSAEFALDAPDKIRAITAELKKAAELGIAPEYTSTTTRGYTNSILGSLDISVSGDVAKQFAGMQGTIAGFRAQAAAAGGSLDEAAIQTALDAWLAKLKQNTVQALQAQLPGAGSAATQILAFGQQKDVNTSNLTAIGGDVSLAEKVFSAQMEQLKNSIIQPLQAALSPISALGIQALNLAQQRDVNRSNLTAVGGDVGLADQVYGNQLRQMLAGADQSVVDRLGKTTTNTDILSTIAGMVRGVSGFDIRAQQALVSSGQALGSIGYKSHADQIADARRLEDMQLQTRQAQELNAATDDETRARIKSAQEIERAALATKRFVEEVERGIAERTFTAGVESRGLGLAGASRDAYTLQFNMQAMSEIRSARNNGYDTNLLQQVLGVEYNKGIAESYKSDLMESYDRQIRAVNDNTTSLTLNYGALVSVRLALHEAAKNLRITDPSNTPLQALTEARKQFEEMVTKFNTATNDAEKQRFGGQLAGLGQSVVDTAFKYYASTDDNDKKRVLSVWEGIGDLSQDQVDQMQHTIDQNQQQITLLAQQKDQAARIGERQLASTETLKAQTADAYAKFDASLASLSSVLKSSGAAGTSWIEDVVKQIINNPAFNSGYTSDGRAMSSAVSPGSLFSVGENRGIARALGYTGEFGSGGHLAWLAADASRKSQFDIASAYANLLEMQGWKGAVDGGLIPFAGFAAGGVVGNGKWNADSVLARYAGGGTIALAGGEFVMPARQTMENLPYLESMRSGRSAGPSNDNAPLLAELRALRAEVAMLARVTAQGAKAIEGSVQVGNQFAGQNATTLAREAARPRRIA